MRELRIHHFFDIIRDYGSGKTADPHPYGHSYHLAAGEIYENKLTRIKLIINNDDICANCEKLEEGHCIDTIDHRADFSGKQEFNNHLDKKIMACMNYYDGQLVDVKEIIRNAGKYIEEIYELYDGNDIEHTRARKENVKSGIRKKLKELGLDESI